MSAIPCPAPSCSNLVGLELWLGSPLQLASSGRFGAEDDAPVGLRDLRLVDPGRRTLRQTAIWARHGAVLCCLVSATLSGVCHSGPHKPHEGRSRAGVYGRAYGAYGARAVCLIVCSHRAGAVRRTSEWA